MGMGQAFPGGKADGGPEVQLESGRSDALWHMLPMNELINSPSYSVLCCFESATATNQGRPEM